MDLDLDLPEAFAPLQEPRRYKVFHGGRGGAKSWSVARVLLVKALQERLRILCAREIQKSIADSVHKLLKDQIRNLDLDQYFYTTHNVIRCASGSEFIFSGLRNTTNAQIKSMEGVDICWVEEAETVSEDSWQILIPTIRKAGSEIWVTFNARYETDPTYKRFVKSPPPGALVCAVGWQDNPWLTDELRDEKDYLYANDPEAAAHVWGGRTRKHNKAQILAGKWVVEAFEPEDDWHGPYQGVDFGYSTDPSVLVRVWVRDILVGERPKRELYVEREVYKVGVELDDLGPFFRRVPKAERYKTRADNSRPETISHVKRAKEGLPKLEACVKGPGSVEHGIDFLRSFHRIVLHPRCTHAKDEAELWSWKVDKLTGEVKDEPADKHDHIWDAVRYALEPAIRLHQKAKTQYTYQSAAKRDTYKSATTKTKGAFKTRTGGML